MSLSSLIEELCAKEENNKTGCKLNFEHECTSMHKYHMILKSFSEY